MTVVLTGIAHIVKHFLVSRVHKRTLDCMYCIVWCHMYGIVWYCRDSLLLYMRCTEWWASTEQLILADNSSMRSMSRTVNSNTVLLLKKALKAELSSSLDLLSAKFSRSIEAHFVIVHCMFTMLYNSMGQTLPKRKSRSE